MQWLAGDPDQAPGRAQVIGFSEYAVPVGALISAGWTLPRSASNLSYQAPAPPSQRRGLFTGSPYIASCP